MARPIPLEVTPRNVREELRSRLERASDEHAEAILAAFELLQQMHDRSVLETACGILSARDKILETLAVDAGSPYAVRAIRNLLFWWRILGSIEPDCFQSVFEAIPQGIAQATKRRKQSVTILGLLRRMMSRESLRALSAAVDFMESFGRRLLAADSASLATATAKEP